MTNGGSVTINTKRELQVFAHSGFLHYSEPRFRITPTVPKPGLFSMINTTRASIFLALDFLDISLRPSFSNHAYSSVFTRSRFPAEGRARAPKRRLVSNTWRAWTVRVFNVSAPRTANSDSTSHVQWYWQCQGILPHCHSALLRIKRKCA